MPHLNFTVDSALLRELGERLVGKPHIALAELVKNGYDADAHNITIRLFPDDDRIEVQDDGNGMSFEEFNDFWMRIGTTHKDKERLSHELNRPMTGSKGVGRLSVQFLARKLHLSTVPKGGNGRWLTAFVDWQTAVHVGDLTKAQAEYTSHSTPPPFEQGTRLVLSGLKQNWTASAIQDLARELWWLQPPFRMISRREEADIGFYVEFESSEKEFKRIFNQQMRAILDIWTARLIGENNNGHVKLALEFAGRLPTNHEYDIADLPHNKGRYQPKANLQAGNFELRIFKLAHRQPHGILVSKAREYFEQNGGIHVYDGGFRLPYYGDPRNDWLGLEVTHSHRIFVSELLPQDLQARYLHTERLRYLPTLQRLFGVVNVSTSVEPGLQIMITRDRLADSIAFEDLRSMIRYALDLYAMEEALRQYEASLVSAPIEKTSQSFRRVEEVLEYYEPQIPKEVFNQIQEKIRDATEIASATEARSEGEVGLLGALATAGLAALAYRHELGKQFSTIRDIIHRIKKMDASSRPQIEQSLELLSRDLSNWVQRAEATSELFDYLADAENIQTKQRFRAISVIKDVKRQTRFLARDIEVKIDQIDPELYLPEATLPEWGAIFQNVFTNAFNAMLDSDLRLLQVTSRSNGPKREILIQDTGHGIDLQNAEDLFQPFKRASKISSGRRALGYGGTGLGLTIIRLLASRIGCIAEFTESDEGFNTAFSLSWRESQ